jgi:hypothetical protein
LQGLDESKYLGGAAMRWIGATFLGMVLGVAVGFLVGEVADLNQREALTVGGLSGALVTLALLALHRTLWAGEEAARRVIPHAGVYAHENQGRASS